MKKYSFSLLFSLLGISFYSQIEEFKNDYIPLMSTGTLPEIYTKSASEKTNADIDALNKTKGVTNRSAKEKFYLNSNFSQDKVLRSGKILFNGPLSNYVNKVADEVFKSAPEVRKQLQIFIVKSDVVNAYCFDNGIILINIGLLAQLDNEAQLAFILAHEASHFVKKHSLESYVHHNTRRGRFSTNVDWDEYKYSQESELEADIQGVKFFKESKYSFKGIPGAFNVLKYSYLPFDEIPFEKTFLEDSNLVFPADYFLKQTAAIKKEEDYDDSKSSHPNIKKRKEAVGKELGEFNEAGREKFIFDQNEFYKIREMSRFELCRIGLLDRDYAACLYSCYMLQKKYPNNEYLKTTIGKALFEVAALKAPENWNYRKVLSLDILDNSESKSVYYDYDAKEGSSQQVYHLLNKMDASQMAVLALNYNWKLRKELKEKNTAVNRLCDSLFVLLALNNSKDISYFNRTTRRDYLNELLGKGQPKSDTAKKVQKLTSLADIDEADSDSKIKRIETSTEKKELSDLGNRDSIATSKLDQYFDKYVFADFLNDQVFVSKYEAAVAVHEAVIAHSKKLKPDPTYTNKGGLGIDKIVVLDPFYLKFDQRNGGSIRYFSSDEKLNEYGDVLKENAQIAGLEFDYVDSKSLKKEDMDKYNDFTLLNDWMGEFLNHNFSTNALVLNNEAAKMLQEKYKTKYMLWTGVIGVKVPKQNIGAAILATFLLYPAPFTIPYLLKKEEITYYVAVLYNLENNKVQFYQTVNMRLSDTRDFLNAFVYDTMNKIKKQPKYKK
ncbi:MAG: M48 family metallopeptidase [Bacteroidota bacterium]|nr:M48 family metallopeptidase [Bacteroidota bacterium]